MVIVTELKFMYSEIKECLACGSDKLTKFISLGKQPLANNLKNSVEEPDELFPLEVNVCEDCTHCQLTVAVDRDMLYKHYLYVSGTSNTLIKEFDDVAAIIQQENPGIKSVLDIACNDGSFLKAFKKYNWKVSGVDPAENIVSVADKDLNIVCDYFPSSKLEDKYDVVTCFNVVAHIPNPYDFLVSCKEKLSEDGTLYIQTSQKNMIVNGEFDTIYHEHHSFFNINSMSSLLERVGLELVDVEFRPVHGTSYLFKIKHKSNIVRNKESLLLKMGEERSKGLYGLDIYSRFKYNIERNKQQLLNVIENSTNTVVGYGAAAKGVVMSNYYGLKHKYIVDENPLKIGKIIGGINVPIASPEVLPQEKEDLTIIVYAWNFYDEIKSKIQKLRPNNNDVIVPSFIK